MSTGFTKEELAQLALSDAAEDAPGMRFGEGSVVRIIWPAFVCATCGGTDGAKPGGGNGRKHQRCRNCDAVTYFDPIGVIVWRRGEQVVLRPDEWAIELQRLA